MKLNWHINVLKDYSNQILKSGLTYLLIILFLLLWNFFLNLKFQWQPIELFGEPNIFHRIFYSAFTFLTLGRILWLLKFYQILHNIFVKGLGMWRLYNRIKVIIWLCLMAFSYFYVVPLFFSTLNSLTSVLFNFGNLILYLIPPVGVAIILSIIVLVYQKIRPSEGIVLNIKPKELLANILENFEVKK